MFASFVRCTRRAVATLLVVALVALALPLSAEAQANRGRRFPDFPQMMRESSVVVLGTVTYVGKEEVKLSISRVLKGEASGAIAVTGFKERAFKPIPDLRTQIKVDEEWVFFLKETLVGSVPYSPSDLSLEFRKKGASLRINPFAPSFDDAEFLRDVPAGPFLDWLHQLGRVARKEKVDAAFLGPMIEKMGELAQADDPGPDAATLLYMISSIQPYRDEAALRKLAVAPDVNTRYIAYTQLPNLPLKAQIDIARNGLDDATAIIQSFAAKMLGEAQAHETISALHGRLDKASLKPVEKIAANPRMDLEPPRRAMLRALISFDSDKALDVIEQELQRTDNTATFMAILDIFKEYEDDSIDLLLLDMMQDADFKPRQVAIKDYFRSIRSPEVETRMKALFDKSDTPVNVRRSIVEILENYRDQSAVPLFIKALQDPAPTVRQAAARAIGSMAPPEAVDPLRDLYFKEPDRLARGFFLQALAEIRDKRAMDALKDLLEQETDPRLKKEIKRAMENSKFLSQ